MIDGREDNKKWVNRTPKNKFDERVLEHIDLSLVLKPIFA
jgi:hypothetical protein